MFFTWVFLGGLCFLLWFVVCWFVFFFEEDRLSNTYRQKLISYLWACCWAPLYRYNQTRLLGAGQPGKAWTAPVLPAPGWYREQESTLTTKIVQTREKADRFKTSDLQRYPKWWDQLFLETLGIEGTFTIDNKGMSAWYICLGALATVHNFWINCRHSGLRWTNFQLKVP